MLTISKRAEKLYKTCQQIEAAKDSWDEIVYENYGCTPSGFVIVCVVAKFLSEHATTIVSKQLGSDLSKSINYNLEPSKFNITEKQQYELLQKVSSSYALHNYSPIIKEDIQDVCALLKRNEGAEFALLCDTMMNANDFCSLLTSNVAAIKDTLNEITSGDVKIDFIEVLADELCGNTIKEIRKYEIATRAQSFVGKNTYPEAGNPFNSFMDLKAVSAGALSIKSQPIDLPPKLADLFSDLDNKYSQDSKNLKDKVKAKKVVEEREIAVEETIKTPSMRLVK